jgi:small multidrug resistance pump
MFQWIIPLAILILFEVIADIFAKSWSVRGGTLLAVCSLVAYLIGNVFWLVALKDGSGLGRGAIIFSIFTAIIASVIGYGFYNEKITGLQLAGILLGIVSVAMILWE